MKTIGLLGGMSWESTVDYYRLINQDIKQTLGGLHSAKIILNSVDFDEIAQLQRSDNWHKAGTILADAAKNIEKAGADFLLICTNTMHLVYPEIQQSLDIPVIHIAESTGIALKQKSIKKVGLIGTAFTMEKPFYRDYLRHNFDIDMTIPDEHSRKMIHQIIFDELCLGIIKEESKQYYLSVINQLMQQGAEAIILGCTEIGMLIKQVDTTIPLFDTTVLHAKHASKLAISI